MSTWRNIADEDIEVDGEDINVFVNSDAWGANYICLKKEYVKELLAKDEEKTDE